jgi:hypothetical protein
MTNQKDSLATLSCEQSNPYLCDPNSFEIIVDDDEVFHGQRSDKLQKQSDAECKRHATKRSRATETSDAAPSKTGRM